MNTACVVCSYMLPKKLIETFISANKFTGNYRQLYVVCREGDNLNLPNHIKVIEVPKMEIFNIGKCSNVGIRTAIDDGHKIIMKTDVDNVLSDEVLLQIKDTTEKQGFCYRYWDIDSMETIGNSSLNPRCMGSIVLHSTTWINVCGYDERMMGYGYEDFAMYKRAERTGINIEILTDPKLYHIDHKDKHNRDTINPLLRSNNIEASVGNWTKLKASESWGCIL